MPGGACSCSTALLHRHLLRREGRNLLCPHFPPATSRADGATVIEKDVGHKTLACLFYVLRPTSFISIIAINEITCGSSPQANACNAAVGHAGIAPPNPELPSRDESSPRPARGGTSRFRAGAALAQADQSPSSASSPVADGSNNVSPFSSTHVNVFHTTPMPLV